MQISGRELLRLLMLDGWRRGNRVTHGIYISRRFSQEPRPRSTVVPDKSSDIPEPTLGGILSVKQLGIGVRGLQELIERYGHQSSGPLA